MYQLYNLLAMLTRHRLLTKQTWNQRKLKTAICGKNVQHCEWKWLVMKLTVNPFVRNIVDIETLRTVSFFHIIAALRLRLCLRRHKNHGQNVKYWKRNSRLHCHDGSPGLSVQCQGMKSALLKISLQQKSQSHVGFPHGDGCISCSMICFHFASSAQ